MFLLQKKYPHHEVAARSLHHRIERVASSPEALTATHKLNKKTIAAMFSATVAATDAISSVDTSCSTPLDAICNTPATLSYSLSYEVAVVVGCNSCCLSAIVSVAIDTTKHVASSVDTSCSTPLDAFCNTPATLSCNPSSATTDFVVYEISSVCSATEQSEKLHETAGAGTDSDLSIVVIGTAAARQLLATDMPISTAGQSVTIDSAARGAVAAIAATVSITKRCSQEQNPVAVDLPVDTRQANDRKIVLGSNMRSMASVGKSSQLGVACIHPLWALFDGQGLPWGRPWAWLRRWDAPYLAYKQQRHHGVGQLTILSIPPRRVDQGPCLASSIL